MFNLIKLRGINLYNLKFPDNLISSGLRKAS